MNTKVGDEYEEVVEMNKIRFVGNVLRRHPQFIMIAARVYWRNITKLIDYHFYDGHSFAPKEVTFKISGACNLNCKMCIVRNTMRAKDNQILPFDLFKKVIDEVRPGKPFISITGGEPLLYPAIIECLEYVNESGLHGGMVTYCQEWVGCADSFYRWD
jgi:pyruvate-formate lyase-activating enzyme